MPFDFASFSLADLLVRAVTGFVLGAIAGSFLATVLIRWPQGKRATIGRSQCDSCHQTLSPRDLVPILSHLIARGRCRRCGASIDSRHLSIEICAGALGLVALAAHPGWDGIVTALFGWWLLLIAAIDRDHLWLPDRLTLPLLVAGLAVGWLGFGPDLTERLIGAAGGFLLLWTVGAAYRLLRGRRGLGGGDPKLLAALGAWIGWEQLPYVLVIAGLLGILAVVLKMLRGETVAADHRLPFGTLMALAAWPIWFLIV